MNDRKVFHSRFRPRWALFGWLAPFVAGVLLSGIFFTKSPWVTLAYLFVFAVTIVVNDRTNEAFLLARMHESLMSQILKGVHDAIKLDNLERQFRK